MTAIKADSRTKEFDDTRTQTSDNATSLFGPRLLFATLFWSITIAYNMAKQKIVIFFVNTNVKAIIAMMMSLSNDFLLYKRLCVKNLKN